MHMVELRAKSVIFICIFSIPTVARGYADLFCSVLMCMGQCCVSSLQMQGTQLIFSVVFQLCMGPCQSSLYCSKFAWGNANLHWWSCHSCRMFLGNHAPAGSLHTPPDGTACTDCNPVKPVGGVTCQIAAWFSWAMHQASHCSYLWLYNS